MRKVSKKSKRRTPNESGRKAARKASSKPSSKKIAEDQAFLRSRERLNKKRLNRDRSMHWAHFWNLCPKCGGDMFEQKADSIFFEVCRKCHGLYIDKAELELAKKFKDPKKMLRAILKRAKNPVIKI